MCAGSVWPQGTAKPRGAIAQGSAAPRLRRGPRARLLHLGLDRRPQGRGGPPLERRPLRRVGGAALRDRAGRAAFRPLAAAVRPLDLRRLRRLRRRRRAPPGAAGAVAAAAAPARLHPRARADPVAVGPLGALLHRRLRRTAARRPAVAAPADVVRRDVPDARGGLLDGAAAARRGHQPLRPDRGDRGEQPLPGARGAARRTPAG